MPVTMPMPSGRTTTTKSFGLEAQRLRREVGPEDAEHADQRRRDPEVDERPADVPVGADVARAPRAAGRACEPTACSRRATALARRSRGLGAGGADGSVKQNTAAMRYERRDDEDQRARAPATVTTSGPSSAKPSANAALSVSVNRPFAASSCVARDEAPGSSPPRPVRRTS